MQKVLTKICFIIFALFFPYSVFAAECSLLVANTASLNEMAEQKNGADGFNAYLEVKAFDNSAIAILQSTLLGRYKVQFCNGDGCDEYNLTDATITGNWFVFSDNDIEDYMNDDFDVALFWEPSGSGSKRYVDYTFKGQQFQLTGSELTTLRGSCLPYYDELPDQNLKALYRTPDGTGDWAVANGWGTFPESPGENNDGINYSCYAGDAYTNIVDDPLTSDNGFWKSTNFNRSIGNWPNGDSLYPSNNEEEDVVFNIGSGQLNIAGKAQSGGHAEYGMVERDFEAELIDTTLAERYVIDTYIRTFPENTNNDVGVVFGYVDDQNYYLARWNKYGAAYANNGSFPGVYQQAELVKVENGTVTQLDLLGDPPVDLGPDVYLRVATQDTGTVVCGHRGDGAWQVILGTQEIAPLNKAGIFSYDNDNGVIIEDFRIDCNDCGVLEETDDLLGFYQFEQDDFATQIDDSSTYGNHGSVFPGGAFPTDAGKYCKAFDSNGNNTDNATQNAFSSGIDVDEDIGSEGTVSFWFQSYNEWSSEDERVLFDASLDIQGGTGDKYFHLSILDDGRLSFKFEDSVDGDFSVTEPSTVSRLGNQWYYVTVTWNFDDNDFEIYVDGQLIIRDQENTNGQLIDLGPIVFGDNSSTYTSNSNGSIPDNHSSRGLFDEVRVYKKVLTQAEIQADMLDSDCEEPDPGDYCAATFIDAVTSHGVGDSINLDTVTIINNPDNFLATSSYSGTATCDPNGSCQADPNGATTELDLGTFQSTSATADYTVGYYSGGTKVESCIIGEANPNSAPFAECVGNDLISNEIDEISVLYDSDLYFSDNFDTYYIDSLVSGTITKIYLAPGDYYINNLSLGDKTELIINGTGAVRIFTNSSTALISNETKINEAGEPTDFLIYAFDNLTLNYRTEANAFIYSQKTLQLNNEVSINGAISANVVDVNYTSEITYDCDDSEPTIDHFLIEHDGSGLTCEAETVIVKACADSNCTSLVENSGATVTLNINGSPLPDSTFEIGPSGLSPYSFNFTTAGTATLSLDQTYECFNGSTDSCDIVFKNAELRFSNSLDSDVGIPTQLSGKNSNVGYKASNLQIEAIQTNPNSGACEAIVVENQYFEIAAECNNPSTCNDNVTINNTSITPSTGGSQNYQSMNIGFDATGIADYTFYYPDAGSMTLHARYNIPVDGVPSGTYITGNSGGFVVRPFGFSVVATGNPKTPDSGNPFYQAAGELFDLTVSAHQWGAGQDVNPVNGEPDEGVDISGNGITDNFVNESVLINHALIAPSVLSGGVLGTLSESTFDNFASGQQTLSVDYDEVGTIRLDAYLADYLGAGSIVGHQQYVGRFTPHHFKQTVSNQGDLTGDMFCGDWAYVGQLDSGGSGAIRYDVQPELTITAYEKNGEITENYTLGKDEGFMKLTVAGVSVTSGAINDVDKDNKNGNDDKVSLVATLDTASLEPHETNNGVMIYTFSDLDHYVYDKVALNEVTAFDAQIPLAITSIEDEDSVTHDDGIDADANIEDVLLEGVNVRFGRALLKNSYGPETSDIPQPFEMQFLNTANQYEINAFDNCSSVVTTASNWIFTDEVDTGDDLTPSDIAMTGAGGNMVDGEFSGVLLQSTNREQGSINVEYVVPSWLMYDWDNDGDHDDNPSAIATFGRFRGNDRIIIWREIGQ